MNQLFTLSGYFTTRLFFVSTLLVCLAIAIGCGLPGKNEVYAGRESNSSERSKDNLWDVQVKDVTVSKLNKKKNTRTIKYKLTAINRDDITEQWPVWVFVKVSHDNGKSWMNTDDLVFGNDLDYKDAKDSPVNNNLSGNVGIVESAGKKKITLDCSKSGLAEAGNELQVRVRAIQMRKIPADKAFKIGGAGTQGIKNGTVDIKQFYLMKYPATYSLYAEFLNERGNAQGDKSDYNHKLWYEDMGKDEDGGMSIKGAVGVDAEWSSKAGRARWPVGFITFWNAYDFAIWAGLALPVEHEWEKAARNVGGLDGVKYAWGNQPEPYNEICNFGNEFKHPVDVRKYEDAWKKLGISNPFGLRGMAGNVWEWQDTYWYDGGGEFDASQDFTDYKSDEIVKNRFKELDKLKKEGKLDETKWLAERKKIALKGWRVIKGGSYFDAKHTLKAASRIVGDSKVRHSAIGCRFIKR